MEDEFVIMDFVELPLGQAGVAMTRPLYRGLSGGGRVGGGGGSLLTRITG